MQYITLSEDNKITAVADWQFPDSVPAKEEVVRSEEGQLVFKSELDEKHEEEVRFKRDSAIIRAKRNRLLAETDYLVMPDYPIDAEKLEQVKEYRKFLRDIPTQGGFPNAVLWYKNPMED